ncbi:alanine--glyoxylate aminotransferase family protein [Nisaea acidiphila]|uniref:Alanine--glyoxylate aminotransferase family protein n=1 Tax=Nisaea acidiphila TaxID=1862145 RepID=A0A9J7ALQ7_9PROT|nr:alanine--glyoxylate aminotransferase family protein [Nisaea acidiphila]UUX48103.1 alanine--glyoxylate aminotransferase family protein [Nisaea acidiphila]
MSVSNSGASLPYRLRLPGPTAVPGRVLQAAARPMVAHRGPEFLARFKSIQQRLQPIIGRGGVPPFLFASTGIGAMESAMVNVAGPGKRVLITTNGQWGPVFRRLAEGIGAEADEVISPLGAPVDLDGVRKALAEKDYAAVFTVHSESSTGALTDLEALGAIVAESDAVLCCDSVSGLAGTEMKADAWGVDVVVSASQKCLMCPPGIGIASISEKAWGVIDRDDRGPRGYFDYRKFRPMAEKGEPTYTAPVAMLNALGEALAMIGETGLAKTLARHKRHNRALTAGLEALGFSVFPTATPSPTLVVVRTPEGISAPTLIDHLLKRYNCVVAGSRFEELKDRLVRIGTMGWVGDEDIRTDLGQIAAALRDLGGAADDKDALAAADAALAA